MALGWIFGLIFFVIGLPLFKDIPIVGLLFIFMGCLALPPIINKIESIFNFHLKFYVKVFIYIFCFLVIWNVPGKYYIPETTKSEELKTEKSIDCWELGFRVGFCSTLSLHGRECDPEDDIVLPSVCQGERITEMGIKRGVESAYKRLGIPH